jgi:hypothetical protein
MMRIDTLLLLAFSAAGCGSATLGRPDGGGGASGGGEAGGGACDAVRALDRSCATAADCVAANHTTNCCGQVQAIGLSASELPRFQSLEARCDATYPACGCAAQQPYADDGSRLRFDDVAGVACLGGVCTTFALDCRAPCAAGKTCFSCANNATVFAACTTACATSAECTDPALPLCQSGSSGNTAGMFCTASGIACDTP